MFEDIFDRIDWNEEWMRRFESKKNPGDSSYWDNRADGFKVSPGGMLHASQSSYLDMFLDYMAIEEGESVFDMGCGAGSTTIPLARAGHQVIAADFSKRMLMHLCDTAAAEGLDTIKTVSLSWQDDWSAQDIPRTDLAIASRSIAAYDLRDCLAKLHNQALRRVCITIAASNAPARDETLLRAVGRSCPSPRSFIYCLNILYQMGIFPETRFIDTLKCDSYPSLEAFEKEVRHQLGEIAPEEEVALERYISKHVVCEHDRAGNEKWHRTYPLMIRWAFISWDK